LYPPIWLRHLLIEDSRVLGPSQTELEREKLESELMEEKKALNNKLKEQERKINNLSTMVICSAGEDFNQPHHKVLRHFLAEAHS